ncbi:MAG: putative Ig domain-containing protein, partial [Deltaproteobacteria bacterium]|nr:putative Ig domain-containing protein [Deltaproteobacteria bacterium]
FTVTDNGSPAESDSETVTISVGNVNRPPVLGSIGSKSVDEGDLLSFTISASDPDGDILTYSASNLPSGANFNSGTRTFSWTPAIGDAGGYNIQFTITDNGSPPESDLEIITITVVDPSVGNLAPDQPVISSPYYGETESDLLLTVETDPFSDPDGDAHKESRWQFVKQSDSSVVLDTTISGHLTELSVPHTVLDRDTTYSVSVQFYDAYSAASGWSDAVTFTTDSTIVDFDGDGIPDAYEVDDTVDLNEDGIPDNDQPDVIKSILSAVGGNEPFGVSRISASIDAIEALEPINPATILDKTNRPETFLFGLASYRLRLNQIGATVLVRVYYSEDISGANQYYLYDTVSGWQDYTAHTTFNQDGRSVTVELKDGGHGDSDGVANGIIVDPGGVAGAASGGLDSGAGSGCFIATAALDSYVEPHVKLQAASYLEEQHDWLKPIVRILLMPLVGVSYILVKTSLAVMILVGFLLIISAISFYTVTYRRRKYQA